eukprot:m51a1_g3260 hypothetical protein (367) ;mRNA; f:192009-193109
MSDRLATSVALFERILSSLPATDVPAFEEAVVRRLPSLRGDMQRADREHSDGSGDCAHASSSTSSGPVDLLDEIGAVLRALVPASGEAPGERTYVPRGHARFEGYTRQNTVSVDAFLYPDDDDVDELCDKGLLARAYCEDCGSRRTQPLNFISHSASRDQLDFIFGKRVLLGAAAGAPENLRGATVVDVGSRLGAVLYAAYAMTEAARIVGVERNEFFARLQDDVVRKRFPQLAARVSVVAADIRDQAQLLGSADVVVLHNAFEWFGPSDEQRELWRFLRRSICKPGCLVVCSPSLRDALAPLASAGASAGGKKKQQHAHAEPVLADLDAWVEELPIEYPPVAEEDEEEDDELRSIHLYRVRPAAK